MYIKKLTKIYQKEVNSEPNPDFCAENKFFLKVVEKIVSDDKKKEEGKIQKKQEKEQERKKIQKLRIQKKQESKNLKEKQKLWMEQNPEKVAIINKYLSRGWK